MDFVPEEPEEEEIIPEVVPTTEEINPNDIFEDTKEAEEPAIKNPRKKREYTEEQKQAMRERMAKVREARKIKGKSKIEEEQAPAPAPQPAPPPPAPAPAPAPQPIPQPIPQAMPQYQVNQKEAQEAIEKMIFAGIQSYEALRKERKAKKKEAQKKEKEHEEFKNTLKRAMNRKATNPYGNGFF